MPAKSPAQLPISRNLRYWRKHYAESEEFREKCRAQSRKAHARRIQDAAYREMRKHTALRRRYGISLAQFRELWDRQNGRCALCENELSHGRGGAQTDHDHQTGRVRGLLCFACNSALGRFERWGAKLEAYLASEKR